jgi:hypothetical protein
MMRAGPSSAGFETNLKGRVCQQALPKARQAPRYETCTHSPTPSARAAELGCPDVGRHTAVGVGARRNWRGREKGHGGVQGGVTGAGPASHQRP